MTILRLLTWNVWAKNVDWQAREKALLATLAETRPDIIALQEAWSEPDGATQTARLATVLGLAHHVQADPPSPVCHRGVGVISRWPITAHDTLTLPAAGQPDEHRIALGTTIATPAGNLPLITTHLNWRLDHSAVRQAQVRYLAETIADLNHHDLPVVLCGDFNAVPDSEEIRMLTGMTTVPAPGVVFQDAWTTAGNGSPGHTWTQDNPHAAREYLGAARIDYIFVQWHPDRSGPIQHTMLVPGDHGDTWVSDHAGLISTLVLQPTDSKDPASRVRPTPP